MNKSPINLWASFLANHKLIPGRVDALKLIHLCELLAVKGTPRVRPYAMRLVSRQLVCETAMENGIDLMSWKHRGRIVMARGLLDAWQKVYQQRYGATFGTAGTREVSRRDVKTKLGEQGLLLSQFKEKQS